MGSGINGDSTVVNGITKDPTVGENWRLNSGSVRELGTQQWVCNGTGDSTAGL